MKTLVLACACVLFLAIHALCQSQYLDSSFSNDGILSYNIPAETKDGKSAKMAIQPDGKIVSAGSYYTDQFFFVSRALADGSADTTFGSQGFVKITKLSVPKPTHPYVWDLLLQPDGKILVLGDLFNGNYHPVIFRLNTDGSTDSSFGTNGYVRVADSLPFAPPRFALQTDGSIVLIGRNYDPVIIRYHSNGAVDSSFGINGRVVQKTIAPFDNILFEDIESDSRARIICSGSGLQGSSAASVAMAYLPNGSIDKSFANKGLFSSDFGVSDNFSQSSEFIKILAGDKILLGGISNDDVFPNENSDITLARLNPEGTPDNTFGNAGKATRHFEGNVFVRVIDMAVDGTGKIMFTGTPLTNLAFWQFDADGSIDSSFADNGELIFPEENPYHYESINSIAFQTNNKLVGAGYNSSNKLYCVTIRLNISVANALKTTITSYRAPLTHNVQLSVFPNPARDFITIAGLAGAKAVTISITDNSGKILRAMQLQSASSFKIDISDLKAGVYYMQIFDGDKSYSLKFIRQ